MGMFENPFRHITEATDAATKIVSLQADLFLLRQELKTMRQIKKAVWIGASIFTVNLLLLFTIYWLEMMLYNRGWSPLSLALLSFVVLGTIAGIFAGIGYHVGKAPLETDEI